VLIATYHQLPISTIADYYLTMMMINSFLFATVALLSCATGNAFQTMVPSTASTFTTRASTQASTALHMANDEDFKRWDKASRSAQADDNVVTLRKPLGLVLNSDDEGNVYVETVAPKGNAARTGKVRICGCRTMNRWRSTSSTSNSVVHPLV
jgi:hypothetical protein